MAKKENIHIKGSSKNVTVVPKAAASAQRRPAVSTAPGLQQPAQKQNLQPNLNKSGRGNNPHSIPTAEKNKVRATQILNALKRIITALLVARRTQAANNAKNQKDNNARRQMNNRIVANLLRTFLNKKLKKLQPPAEQSKPEVKKKKKKHAHFEEAEQTAVTAKENEPMAANNFIVSNVNKPMPEPTPLPPPRPPVATEPQKSSVVSHLLGKALLTLLMSHVNELLATEKEDAKQVSVGADNMPEEITAKELAQSIGAMTDDELEEFISTMQYEELAGLIGTMQDEEFAGLIGTMKDDETQALTNAIAADKEQAEFNTPTAGATPVQPNLQAQDSLLKAAASKTERQPIADEAAANNIGATVKSPANR